MGRFYRTASAAPIDYMNHMDIPLMERALTSADADISQSLDQTAKIGQAALFNYLPQDEENAKSITDSYTKQVDAISEAIRKDPANWKQQAGTIRDLTRKLQDSYTNGEISQYAGSYSQMKSDFAQADKQAELWHTSGGKKGTDPTKVNLWKQHALSNFKGTKTSDGYRKFQTNPLTDNIDLAKALDDSMKSIVKDKNVVEFTQGGGTWNDISKSWEGIKPEKLLSVAMSKIKDPVIMNTLKQDSDIGYIHGAFNDDGNLKSPFAVKSGGNLGDAEKTFFARKQTEVNLLKHTDKAKGEAAQKDLDEAMEEAKSKTSIDWDNSSYLTPILRGAIDKYSGVSTTDKSKLRVNPYALSNQNNAAALQRLKVGQSAQDGRQERLFQHQDAAQEKAHEYDMEKLALQAANKSSKTGKGVVPVKTGELLATTTTTPFGFTASTPDDAVNKLANTLNSTKESINKIVAAREDAKKSGDDNMALYLNNQLASVKATENTINARRTKAMQDAVDNVVPKSDMDLYQNRDNVEKEYLATTKGYPPNMAAKLFPEITEKYYKTKNYSKLINSEYKNQIYKAAKETTNGAAVIGTTDAQDAFIKRSWETAPDAFKIIDPTTGAEDTKYSGLLDPTDPNIKIIGAGPSAGAGSKNIPIQIEITKDNKKIRRNLIPVGPTARIVEDHLINDWSKSKDAGIKQIVGAMSSPFYRDVNDAITSISQKDNNDLAPKSAAVFKTIKTPTGMSEMSIEQVLGGYTVKIKGADGGYVALPHVTKDAKGNVKLINGPLSSDADIVNSLQALFPQQ